VGAGALFAAGIALAASQTIVGTASNTYDAPTYTTDQGEVVPFQVTGSSHNVTAGAVGPDGKALFRSSTISGGSTPVNGTQYLTAGTYTFMCTIHPSTMQATLVVTGNGTPQARPQINLSIASKKLGKVAKKGKLQVQVTATQAAEGATLEAKLGKASLGKGSFNLSAGPQSEVLKLSKSGKAKLAKKSKASILVNGTVPFGSPASAKGKLK
jgi:plastocyanin